jgi:hypothetical protein
MRGTFEYRGGSVDDSGRNNVASPVIAGDWTEYRAKLAGYFDDEKQESLGGSNLPRSATQSVIFHSNWEMATDPRMARGFRVRCEPEKAISLRIV